MLVISPSIAFTLDVGDKRVYRINEGGFGRLTKDHTVGHRDFADSLSRALGFEEVIPFNLASFYINRNDRFLQYQCGVNGALTKSNLPIRDLPNPGEIVDNFRMNSILSNGRYNQVMRVTDLLSGKEFAMKFPHPRVAKDKIYRIAFLNEALVTSRVRSPFIGEIIEVPQGRMTRLYIVMPFYDGQTLEERLRHAPKVGFNEGVSIALRLARAIATLHRSGFIHGDVKPENVILLRDGGLRLIDLGGCREKDLNVSSEELIKPGTARYMAPELLEGEPGTEASDIFALGVTIYRMFCGAYPYGSILPFSKPRFVKPKDITTGRPDLPAWLNATLLKAVAVNTDDRFTDVLEFVHELKYGSARSKLLTASKNSFYQRGPKLFWMFLSLAFIIALLVSQFICKN